MKGMRLRIVNCALAEKDHRRSKRQYAHTLHKPNAICVAESFWDLPDSHFYGILAHEIGHVIAAKKGLDSEEHEADDAANEEFGILIRYRSTEHGKELEYLTKEDVQRVRDRSLEKF